MALIFDNTGPGNVTLKSSSSGTYTLTFPTTSGTLGQFLKTDGAGNLSWDTAPSVSPGGLDTHVQFNDSGVFGGSSSLTFNKATGALSVGGNLVLISTASKIVGDFSNATPTNRVLFQSSTTNGQTDVGIITNGTGTSSSISVYNGSDPNNANVGKFVANGATDVRIVADKTGTGSYTSLTFVTNNTDQIQINTSGQLLVGNGSSTVPSIAFKDEFNTGFYRPGAGSVVFQVGGTETIRTDSTRNVVLGSGSLTTSSTDGFVYLAGTPGIPTGIPSSFSGHNAITYDTSNDKLYVYNSGWKDINSVISTTLNDLSDVVITTPATGATLIYDGSNWIDGAIDLADTDAVTGTLPIASGGTGQTTANAALNALLPSQTSNNGKALVTDGTDTSWVSLADNNTTYTISAETTTGGANLRLTGSDASTDDVKFAGAGIAVVTRTDANTITITATESDTLADVTGRGATTTTAISITNTTDATSNATGALIVDGGISVDKNIFLSGSIVSATSAGSAVAYDAAVTANLSTTSQTAVDSWAIATYRSAKYLVQITQSTNYQVSEIMVIHNGTTTTMTEFAVLETNGALATFASDVSGGNARLLCTMGSATAATINIKRTLIVV